VRGRVKKIFFPTWTMTTNICTLNGNIMPSK
jgi:hypothetical protein